MYSVGTPVEAKYLGKVYPVYQTIGGKKICLGAYETKAQAQEYVRYYNTARKTALATN
jgi:hypothetical protein